MRLTEKDNIHSAISKVCEKNARAGSIVVLIQREHSTEEALGYLGLIDKKGLYGAKLADFFFQRCAANLDIFLAAIKHG